MFKGPESDLQPPAFDAHRTDAPRDDLLAASEAAWAPAMAVSWGPPRYATRFRALWTPEAQALCVRFDVDDEAPWHTMTERGSCLWEEEVVEIFLDPTGTGADYAELEISPANVVCDLHIERLEPVPVAHMGWHFAALETTVHQVPGTDGWTAVAWMPFSDFASLSPGVANCLPVEIGDSWKCNVFRIKRPHGPAAPERDAVYAAWSVPSGPSFHAPAAFRPLRFL
jgi:hypothetical protein